MPRDSNGKMVFLSPPTTAGQPPYDPLLDIANELSKTPTRAEITGGTIDTSDFVTGSQLSAATAPLVTGSQLSAATAGLVTSTQLTTAVSGLATAAQITDAVTGFRLQLGMPATVGGGIPIELRNSSQLILGTPIKFEGAGSVTVSRPDQYTIRISVPESTGTGGGGGSSEVTEAPVVIPPNTQPPNGQSGHTAYRWNIVNSASSSGTAFNLPSPSIKPGAVLSFTNRSSFPIYAAGDRDVFDNFTADSSVIPLLGGAATSLICPGSWTWVTLVSDGTNWITVAGGN